MWTRMMMTSEPDRSTSQFVLKSRDGLRSFVNREPKNVFHFYLLLMSEQLNESSIHCNRVKEEMCFTSLTHVVKEIIVIGQGEV